MKVFTVNVSKRGVVTIPAELRRHLGLKPPCKVIFRIQDDGQIYRIAPDDGISKKSPNADSNAESFDG